MHDTTLLRLHDVAHAFDYPLFTEVSFTLLAGESMAITGRSGSGKSTLLHIASGFLTPQQGTVTLLGQELYDADAKTLERIRRYDVGVVFQSHYLFKGMSGKENIEAACLLAGTDVDAWLLEKLAIADVIDQPVASLSGGQQQRVSVARVLAKRPRLIFADEPTGNLDNETAALVMDALSAYIARNDAALMLVTHDETLAARCSKRYRLSDCRLRKEVR